VGEGSCLSGWEGDLNYLTAKGKRVTILGLDGGYELAGRNRFTGNITEIKLA
jgi:hypothetical protein